MRIWLPFIYNLLVVLAKLLIPGSAKRLVSENIALKQQLLVMNRKRKCAPHLTHADRVIFGVLVSLLSLKRIQKIAVILKPATLLKFHKALVKRKYHLLFSKKLPRTPGPKGPEQAIIDAIVEMKKHNPTYGQRRIAMQISNAFGIEIDKDIVRRVLSKYYKNNPGDQGLSWLTFIGHMKDSLWSVDFFRAESIHLQSHWVMVVMDQFTRRIIGFAVHAGDLHGVAVCCIFNKMISGFPLPNYLSSDHDPLFRFHRWQANLRVLDVKEIKSVPHTPTSHPFIERLIGTVRRELLDRTLFWNASDLQNKLQSFQVYYNEERGHCGIDGLSPQQKSGEQPSTVISLDNYKWKKHCRGLFELPLAA